MPPDRSQGLDALLKVAADAEALPQLSDYPDVELARQALLTKARETLSRLVPDEIAALERQRGWAVSFNSRMEFFTNTLLAGPDAKDALIGKAEMRRKAPSFGHVLDALKERPELLTKVQQGFVLLQPVPIGLSPDSFREPLGNALRLHKAASTLRSTDGTPLALDTSSPVWMWDEYEGADAEDRLVYFPQRFGADHGGRTKQQLLAESPFPGWQVLLLENLRDIPKRGQGRAIGGRPQLEAGKSPEQYLALLNAEPYAREQGLTPEAWQSLFLSHLTETGGEVLDNYDSGSVCYQTGAYFPSSRTVPRACWLPGYGRAHLDRDGPDFRDAYCGVRAAVRVA